MKAIRGDAVLFYSLLPNGTVDPLSEHGSCATLKGEKFSATKWVRSRGRLRVVVRFIIRAWVRVWGRIRVQS